MCVRAEPDNHSRNRAIHRSSQVIACTNLSYGAADVNGSVGSTVAGSADVTVAKRVVKRLGGRTRGAPGAAARYGAPLMLD